MHEYTSLWYIPDFCIDTKTTQKDKHWLWPENVFNWEAKIHREKNNKYYNHKTYSWFIYIYLNHGKTAINERLSAASSF